MSRMGHVNSKQEVMEAFRVFDPQSAQTQPLPADFAITPSPDSLRATVRIVVPAEESASPTAPAAETVTSPVKTEAV